MSFLHNICAGGFFEEIKVSLLNLWQSTGLHELFATGGWQNIIMVLISCVLVYACACANEGLPRVDVRLGQRPLPRGSAHFGSCRLVCKCAMLSSQKARTLVVYFHTYGVLCICDVRISFGRRFWLRPKSSLLLFGFLQLWLV